MIVPRTLPKLGRWFGRSEKNKVFGTYEVISKTGQVSAVREVPDHIERPPYILNQGTNATIQGSQNPEIKNYQQIEGMRAAGKLARKILNLAKDNIQVGVTTDQIDEVIHKAVIDSNAYPSPLGYKGFPKSCCTSVNNVVCHGIPDDRPLLDGDIVNVDITVFYGGFHGDCSETFLVGNVDDHGRKLVDATKKSLEEAIKICQPGRPFNAIGRTIDSFIQKAGFHIVPVFTGHGIGNYFHGAPDIFHFTNSYSGIMEPGMTFTIEPAVSQGSNRIIILKDNWTAITRDGSRSAQFEHTVLITENGVEILTA